MHKGNFQKTKGAKAIVTTTKKATRTKKATIKGR
jgi:hypothetical protein